MNLVNLLRKIGVLRFGTKKYTFTSGRDMPAEALFDDVFDPDKDLVSRKKRRADLPPEGKRFCAHCGVPRREADFFCRQCGTKLGG